MSDVELIRETKKVIQTEITNSYPYSLKEKYLYVILEALPRLDQGGIPEGWALVPVEPTGAILGAMYECDEDAPWTVLYKAILSAAPKPPTQGGE